MAKWPYSSPAWTAVRKVVLARDGYRCQIRGPKCRGWARAVDHIVDWRDGGAVFGPANLRSACISCNNGKRNRHLASLARQARDAGGRFTDRPVYKPSRDW
jgi:5-methylcytosine-specific restriction endonuclease McrA